MPYQITARDNTITGTIRLPGSKSIANRLLMMRAYSGKHFDIDHLPDCEDTRLLQQILGRIGETKNTGHLPPPVEIDCGNAGTVMRFLMPYLAYGTGNWILTGSERMKHRPVGPLVEALQMLGADLEYLEREGYPPVMIRGKSLEGGKVSINPGASSQFVSSMLLAAPVFRHGLQIELEGKPVSEPYIELTINLMEQAGIQVAREEHGYKVPCQEYGIQAREVEADWSAASYWYEMAALATEAAIHLPGLSEKSLQGDKHVVDYFRALGIVTNFTHEGVFIHKAGNSDNHQYPFHPVTEGALTFAMKDHPDLVPAVAVAAACSGKEVAISGVEHLRIKESDRLAALEEALKKAGFEVVAGIGSLSIAPNPAPEERGKRSLPPPLPSDISKALIFRTHNDHRMAMALAPLALRFGSVILDDIRVVEKSYPGFWKDLQDVGFVITFTA